MINQVMTMILYCPLACILYGVGLALSQPGSRVSTVSGFSVLDTAMARIRLEVLVSNGEPGFSLNHLRYMMIEKPSRDTSCPFSYDHNPFAILHTFLTSGYQLYTIGHSGSRHYTHHSE